MSHGGECAATIEPWTLKEDSASLGLKFCSTKLADDSTGDQHRLLHIHRAIVIFAVALQQRMAWKGKWTSLDLGGRLRAGSGGQRFL